MFKNSKRSQLFIEPITATSLTMNTIFTSLSPEFREDISIRLLEFLARTVPDNEVNQWLDIDKTLSMNEKEHIVTAIASSLKRANKITIDTINLQTSVHDKHFCNEKLIQTENARRYQELSSRANDLAHVQITNYEDSVQLAALYNKIFDYIYFSQVSTLIVDKSSAESVVRAAFESVFPRIGLKAFSRLPLKQKITELVKLTKLVLGIIIFNKKTGQQCTCVHNLVLDMTLSVQKKLADLDDDLRDLCGKINRFQSNESVSIIYKNNDFAESTSIYKKLTHGEMQDIDTIQLTYLSQCQQHIKEFRQRLADINDKIESNFEFISSHVKDLQAITGSNAGISKDAVYPKFTAIGTLWFDCTDEYTKFNFFQDSYSCFLSNHSKFSRNSAYDEQLAFEGRSDKFIDRNSSLEPDTIGNECIKTGCELIWRTCDLELQSVVYEFNGYCPVILVDKAGYILSGNDSFGIIRYREFYYVFSSRAALRLFALAPEMYLQQVRKLVCLQPQYMRLLNVMHWFSDASKHLFPNFDSKLSAVDLCHQQLFVDVPRFQSDASTETPTHFIEKNIDYNYRWNEWDIRRDLLKYVHLTECKTTSQQTINTHFRRENSTQVYLPKEKDTQTKRDSGTNPKQVTTYITGLGAKCIAANGVSRYVDSKSTAQNKGGSSELVATKHRGNKRNGATVVTLTLDL